MGEHSIGPEHDRVPPLSRRHLNETDRRAKLLDLVHGAEEMPGAGRFEEEFFLEPHHVFELFKETQVGDLLPKPGEIAVDALVDGLGPEGHYWAPSAKRVPDTALCRRTLVEPLSGRPITLWRRSLGVVFQFHYRHDSRVITADFEVGVTVQGGAGINIVTKRSVLVNQLLFIVGLPKYYTGKAAVVDEFLENIENLTKPPVYSRDFEFPNLGGQDGVQ